MNNTIDSLLPIEKYFEGINYCIQYGNDGNMMYMAAQVIQKDHHAVLASGIYIHECKEWRKTPKTDKRGLGSRSFTDE